MTKLMINDYDKHVYETELKSFLPDEFIDIHTHLWLNSMGHYGSRNGGSSWEALVADEMSAENLDDFLKRLFPENRVTPLVFGSCLRVHKEVNDYTFESGRKYNWPTLYRTDYVMEPDFLEEEINKNGFLGIKPYLSNCPSYIPNPEIRIFDFLPKEHLEVANKNGWIVMLHIPRNKRLRDEVNIAQLMEIEEKYPNLKLIVAHIGRAYSPQDIGDAFEVLKNTKNMLFDFTANVCVDAIEACIKAVGTDRLFFGSDLPIALMKMYRIVDENGCYYNVVPRGLYGDVEGEPHMKETDEETVTFMIYEQIRALKEAARRLNLSDNDIEKIMYTNSKKLLGL